MPGHRNSRAAEDRILLVTICIQELRLLHNPPHTNPSQERADLCRSADIPKITDLQAHSTEKLQSETARPTNTRDNQMARDKRKKFTYRNQGYLLSPEPSSPTTASPGYPNTLEKEDSDLKSHLRMLIETSRRT